MQWDKATDIILITSIAMLGVFAALGLVEWIRRKSLKKVDPELLAMFPSLVLMAAIYFIFDKVFILSLRPDGSGEPSFPSTHAMVVATIFFMAMFALPKYIKNKTLLAILDIVMLALIALTAYGRVAANKHWASDVVCGVVFAALLAALYYLIIKQVRKKHE